MKKVIARLIFLFAGWKEDYNGKYVTDKCVMIAAPHTSNWDLLFAMAVYWHNGVEARFFIKNSYTKGVLGYLFRWLGAIGVDRSKHKNLVDFAVNLFENSKGLVLLIPAEGTRNLVEHWRTGFYHIALKANVPVSLGYLDYKNKIAGVGDLHILTGDFEKDMQRIQDFYKDVQAKHPEFYNKHNY